MEFEAPSLESSWLGSSAEGPKESSEKQRESYKKAQAQIQKSRKDEKKAKWDNDALFNILFRFIQNPFYEEFIPIITELLAQSVPSRFIINLTALVYPESALYVLTYLDRKDDINLLLGLHRYEQVTEFDDVKLHSTIRTWMSTWSQVTQQFLLDREWSVIMYQKLLSMIQWKENELLSRSLFQFIRFFFYSRNVKIPDKTARSYGEFLLKEYTRTLKAFLSDSDQDLLLGSSIPLDASTLFGLSRD